MGRGRQTGRLERVRDGQPGHGRSRLGEWVERGRPLDERAQRGDSQSTGGPARERRPGKKAAGDSAAGREGHLSSSLPRVSPLLQRRTCRPAGIISPPLPRSTPH
ncbi:hypothetical protein T492DRAFT_1780 [Pavlovales sp. CCMP2436]|nr:hypothetical protein T492DRAFT_1780 [Pavlovales sp. CCMP2436]